MTRPFDTGNKALTVPDRASAIIAWRAWRITYGRLPYFEQLRSTNLDVRWPYKKPMVAQCTGRPEPRTDAEWVRLVGDYQPHSHVVPEEKCNCGVYAVKRPQGARRYATVVGRVALWGKVVEGTSGYRAEFAYPTELYLHEEDWPHRAGLKRYGVPVLPFPLLERLPEWSVGEPESDGWITIGPSSSTAHFQVIGYEP